MLLPLPGNVGHNVLFLRGIRILYSFAKVSKNLVTFTTNWLKLVAPLLIVPHRTGESTVCDPCDEYMSKCIGLHELFNMYRQLNFTLTPLYTIGLMEWRVR